MLNNLTNFLNLKGLKRFKTIPEPKDVFPMGTRDRKFRGGYKPTAIQWEDLLAAVSAGTIQDLESVLAVGNTTGTNNILLGLNQLQFAGDSIYNDFSLNIIGATAGIYFEDETAASMEFSGGIGLEIIATSQLWLDTTTSDGTLKFMGANGTGFNGTLGASLALTADRTWRLPDATGTIALTNTLLTEMSYASSDATTPLVVANNIGGMFATHDMTINSVFAGVAIVGTTAGVTDIDILVNGVSIFGGALNTLTIDFGEATSLTAATVPVIVNPNISRGDRISTNITTLTTGGTEAGLQITLNGVRT